MLVRGGYVLLHTGSLRGAGLASYYWSATTYPTATYAYYLHFHSTNVYPSHYYNRFLGFSVRCIVFFFSFFLFLLSPFLPSSFSLPYVIWRTDPTGLRYSKSRPERSSEGFDLEYLTVRKIMYGREKRKDGEKEGKPFDTPPSPMIHCTLEKLSVA